MKKMISSIQTFVAANRKELSFILVFILVFAVVQSLYFLSRPMKIPYALQTTNASFASFLINTVTPKEDTSVEGTHISGPGISLEIAWGCEGIEGIFLVIAALAAYRMDRRAKLIGILTGVVFLYLLNIVRIMGLFYTVKYAPAVFDVMHMYVGQTFIIFFGVLFFAVWIYRYA